MPALYNTTQVLRSGSLKLIIGPPGDSSRPQVTTFNPDCHCDHHLGANSPPPARAPAGRRPLAPTHHSFDQDLGTSRPQVDAAPAVPTPFGKTGGVMPPGTDHCDGTGLSGGNGAGPKCAAPGCLFDVKLDPSESNDLSRDATYATQLAAMRNRLHEAAQTGMPPADAFPSSERAAQAACVVSETPVIDNRRGFGLEVLARVVSFLSELKPDSHGRTSCAWLF